MANTDALTRRITTKLAGRAVVLFSLALFFVSEALCLPWGIGDEITISLRRKTVEKRQALAYRNLLKNMINK
jgi:hypothetical protein